MCVCVGGGGGGAWGGGAKILSFLRETFTESDKIY